ncbi:MAG: hypothetical protein SFX19_05480 [Alphaproteobacteria bacterium]|nr:hypothetical protein [Alphaproteobacteria bacterium]
MHPQHDHQNTPIHHLFIKWCRAEYHANFILNQTEDEATDPRYLEATNLAQRALWDFVCTPTSSLYGILLKLKVACQFDDYTKEAIHPDSRLISPKAIISALHDLENVVIACFGADGIKQQDEELDSLARCGLKEAEDHRSSSGDGL